MTKGQRIKKAREDMGISQTELASRIGVSKQNLYKYENSIITNIPSDKIESIARICKVSPEYIMGWSTMPIPITEEELTTYGIRPIKTKKFPMLGKIACGEPIYADADYETFVEASADINADFCLTAKGDSMINARIFDGDVVFIKRQPSVENGEIAAVIINDEVTLKRVYLYSNNGKLVLNPENPKYEPLVYTNEELNQIHILGKAVAFQSYVR